VQPFDIIDHTADIGIRAYGSTLAEAFVNMAVGLSTIITEPETIRQTDKRVANITAPDVEALLFEWMNYLIFVFDVENLLFSRFKMIEFTDEQMVAECWGEKYDPSRHELKLGVKSATYHMLEVDREGNSVQVIFDV